MTGDHQHARREDHWDDLLGDEADVRTIATPASSVASSCTKLLSIFTSSTGSFLR